MFSKEERRGKVMKWKVKTLADEVTHNIVSGGWECVIIERVSLKGKISYRYYIDLCDVGIQDGVCETLEMAKSTIEDFVNEICNDWINQKEEVK